MKTTTCDHEIRVRGDQKVCATCKAPLGPVYTSDRLNDDIRFLLGRISLEYDTLKAKFIAETDKDPSNAIRWHAYDLLVSQHRAAYTGDLLKALEGAQTSAAKRDLLLEEKSRLTRHLTRASAAEWDSSTSPFGNQDMKARTVADARSLKALEEIMGRFEKADADRALPQA